jgi:hypothetical protein
MRERPVPERAVGAKGQHAPSELLIGDVDDLRVVVGIRHDHASTGLRHADHLRQRDLGLGEVLERAVGPAAVEARVLERQRLRTRDVRLAVPVTPRLVHHRPRDVDADDLDAELRRESQGVRPGPGTDVEVRPVPDGLEQLQDPPFVRRVRRLPAQPIENADPRGRLLLLVDRGKRMLGTIVLQGPNLSRKPHKPLSHFCAYCSVEGE